MEIIPLIHTAEPALRLTIVVITAIKIEVDALFSYRYWEI